MIPVTFFVVERLGHRGEKGSSMEMGALPGGDPHA
jgi:hypothetical protein